MAASATTTELAGARAQARYARMSAYKAREVLDLIRGLPVDRATEVLRFTERAPATAIGKVLASAIANAEHNDQLDGSTLYVSACYADEGPTLKRWRPRARGRATRIRKRTCHITVVVSVMPAEMLTQVEAERSATDVRGEGGRRRGRAAREARRARVARSRAAEAEETEETEDQDVEDAEVQDAVEDDAEIQDEVVEADETEDEVEDEVDEADADDDQEEKK
jgi:large subunit ribosomal protein L22